jgi:hypothetical protein
MLAAIAKTEFALAEIIMAKANKIEAVVEQGASSDIAELLKVNKSAERMMRKVLTKEMLLGFQLEDLIELSTQPLILSQANQAP